VLEGEKHVSRLRKMENHKLYIETPDGKRPLGNIFKYYFIT